jgi:hypothetical protein
MTAIIEHHDHRFEVLSYHDFCERTGRQPKGIEPSHPLEETRSRPFVLPIPAAAPELMAA